MKKTYPTPHLDFPWLTKNQAMRTLDCGETYLERVIRDFKIETKKVGKKVYLSKTQLYQVFDKV